MRVRIDTPARTAAHRRRGKNVSESSLYNQIIGEFSHGDTRLFRQNTALAWQGTVIERTPTRLVLSYPRPIHVGAVGMSDLIGWSPKLIAGRLTAVYSAIECKLKGKYPTDEQQAFLDLVTRSGGRAGVARSVEDAGRLSA